MSPKATSTRRANSLRQGTLSFASMKRTSSTASVEKVKKSSNRSTPKSKLAHDSSEEEEIDSFEPPSSGEESDIEVEAPKSKSSKAEPEAQVRGLFLPKNNVEIAKVEERPPLNPKDPKWRKQYAYAKEQLDGFKLIHGEGQNKVHEILRVFDLSYQYGPCIGVTRLERWERAHALGLDPPQEIKEILSTRQGVEEAQYSQCVFYDEV